MTAIPASADRKVGILVRVNGDEKADFYKCIQSLTVTEDLEAGSSFMMEVVLHQLEDGAWNHLEDEDLLPWSRITLSLAFPEQKDVLFDGYITHLEPAGPGHNEEPRIRLRGADASFVMNLEEKTKVWTGKTYEQIAQEVIELYGLKAVPPPPGEAPPGEPPAVAQRSTDRRFLKELARRKGYEFYVRGGEAHFHPPDLTTEPQKLIAFHFGQETNCHHLMLELAGTRPTRVDMARIDPLSGAVQQITSVGSDLQPMGNTDPAEMRGYGVPDTAVVVRHQGAVNEAQMTDYVEGVMRRHGWWVKASGKLDGLVYGGILRAHRQVTIKGFGKAYNGAYYVRRTVHKVAPRTYEVEFDAYRNRLEQLGTEDFEGERPGDYPVPPPANSAYAAGDELQVSESGPQVKPA